MKRIHTKQKAVLMTGLGILFTFGAAVPAFAGNVSASITDTGSSVGIGTTTPTARLDIAGGGGGSLRFSGNAGSREIEFTGVGGFELFQTTSNYLQFGTNNLPRMTISASGNVGIGTMTPGSFNLYVAAPTQMTAFGSTANGTRSLLQFYAKDGGGVSRGRMLGYDPIKQNIVLDAGGDGTANNVVINNVGNVGIGTTSPGNIRLLVDYNSANNLVGKFINANASGYGLEVYLPNATGAGQNVLSLNTGVGSVMVARNDGNVGIGTTGPSSKLHVIGGNSGGAGNGNQVVRFEDTVGSGLAIDMGGVNNSYGWIRAQTVGAGERNLVLQPLGGNIGIGTTNPGAYRLAVKGKIRAEEVVVDTGWADFVFKKDYDLMPLEKVAKHIEEAGHLPGIPTEKEVQENGISIGQIQSKLLQKIEEMTLYVIELKKENDQLKERISSLENRSR